MNEFSIIDTFFNKSTSDACLLKGVGDDGAIIRIPQGYDLVVSTDTLVNEVHFLMDWSPECIARRVLNVNISDMVAMAAVPHWVSLALSLPEFDEHWLSCFSSALQQALKCNNMQLIGGDTTKGPLVITLTIHGLVEHDCAVRRSGAHVGDHVYVSGALGAAALAVQRMDEGCDFSDAADKRLLQALQEPKPRVDFIPILKKFSSAAIDISDGLLADLEHICQQSNCGAVLNLSDIPVDTQVEKVLAKKGALLALSGGDDYEICFTIPQVQHQAFLGYCNANDIEVFRIGSMVDGSTVKVLDKNNQSVPLKNKGYQHFS